VEEVYFRMLIVWCPNEDYTTSVSILSCLFSSNGQNILLVLLDRNRYQKKFVSVDLNFVKIRKVLHNTALAMDLNSNNSRVLPDLCDLKMNLLPMMIMSNWMTCHSFLFVSIVPTRALDEVLPEFGDDDDKTDNGDGDEPLLPGCSPIDATMDGH